LPEKSMEYSNFILTRKEEFLTKKLSNEH
jgi:hypothetical protein